METLQTPHGKFTICLNPIYTPIETLFHVSFVDKNNKTHRMLMHCDFDLWKFSCPEEVPDWFINMEPQLGDLITRECLKGYRGS